MLPRSKVALVRERHETHTTENGWVPLKGLSEKISGGAVGVPQRTDKKAPLLTNVKTPGLVFFWGGKKVPTKKTVCRRKKNTGGKRNVGKKTEKF